jgi:hypothetical protein
MFLFFIYLSEINRKVHKAENLFNLWLDLTAEFAKSYLSSIMLAVVFQT